MFKIHRRTIHPVTRFEECENGAVTVDWVVLSATIVIFGSVMIGIYKGGVFNLSTAISETVTNQAPDPDQSPWR